MRDDIEDALESAILSVTKQFRQEKKQTKRNESLRRGQLAKMRRYIPREMSIKDAAYAVMEKAYLKASSNGRLPANARQVMYAARPLVLELTDGKCWKDSAYFTQNLLPNYVEQRGKGWNIVYDDRGHLAEPHTKKEVGLGTLNVRDYISSWHTKMDLDMPEIDARITTKGPKNRYKFALFIEKEGFNALLEDAQIAERYDLAIMSTKGMSVTASRMLVESLSRQGVTILILHDFDKSGFEIAHTLAYSTWRYRYGGKPTCIDLGLRLTDVEEMNLAGEGVNYPRGQDPHRALRRSGATQAECDFLVRGDGWGERVELNAMDSQQFLDWLEGKLRAQGVTKIVPDQATLAGAYERAAIIAAGRQAMEQAMKDFKTETVTVPEDLVAQINSRLEARPELAWDEALVALFHSDSDDETPSPEPETAAANEPEQRPNAILFDPSRVHSLVQVESEPTDSVQERNEDLTPGTHFRAGQRVYHAKFGEGTVIGSRMDAEHGEEVQVRFNAPYGMKLLVARFANLIVLGEDDA